MKKHEEIDANFKYEKAEHSDSLVYYDIPNPAFTLVGVNFSEENGFTRLPIADAKRVSEDVEILAYHTSGGRLLFKTDSKKLEIRVSYPYLTKLRNLELAASGFVLIERRGDERRYIKIMPPDWNADTGYSFTVDLEGGMREYILYFPICTRVRTLSIGLDEGAAVMPLNIYTGLPILYYGSSITQGFCAGRPDNTYEAFIEKWSEVDFINLGFSGSGRGEDAMIEYLSGIDCRIFVCDYNHSGVNLDYFAEQHPKLYREFRRTHPNTPILFLTKTCVFTSYGNIESHERAAAQEKIIEKTYKDALASGDENVYFLSGVAMFDEFSATDRMSLVNDSDHPNELGFYVMAKKIYDKLSGIPMLL